MLFNWILDMAESFLGGFDNLIKALFIFSLVDYITRVVCVLLKKSRLKEIGIIVICRKLFIFILIGVATIMDEYIIGTEDFCRSMLIIFYCFFEVKSIVKNAKKLGVKTPTKFENILNGE